MAVHSPREVKSTLSSYIVYTVAYSDRTGPAEVVKRYSDFDAARNAMAARWPGIYVPALPPKKVLGMSEEFIVERCGMLAEFCKGVAERPHLWYGQEFQIFLGENDVDKKLAGLPKQNYRELLEKYQKSFEYAIGKDINTEVLVKVVGFSGFINKCLPLMDSYREAMQTLLKLQ